MSAKDKATSRYLLGIDTGGTFTDGVLLDYKTRAVLSSAKTLTTYGDLARGVTEVIGRLDIDDPALVELVGISSTLATNSVAEGKTRRTGLLLIGYDPDLISQYKLDDDFGTDIVAYFKGGHTSQGEEQAPLDLAGIEKWVTDNRNEVEALAVSSYFSPLNSTHEQAVLEAVSRISELPVVLGHQLSTRLDSIKRASTACLNASLVAVMHEFTAAVQQALKSRRVTAPLMVVKGNGSLMPQTEAISKPVETVLSGPAASTIGGRFFSETDNALVIDIGGTTTDMALMRDNHVAISEEGARVGEIKTAVRAARIRTAVVGCDSRVHTNADGELLVGPDRVVPLSRLAADFPNIREDLERLKKRRGYIWKASDLVYWFQQKKPDPETLDTLTPAARRLFKVLGDAPQSLSAVLQVTGVHHEVQLNAEDLMRRGYLGVATLTPTDLLHFLDEMDNWCRETARLAVSSLSLMCGRKTEDLVNHVLDGIIATITEEAIVFLAREKNKRLPENIDGKWGRWFFDKALAKEEDSLLSFSMASRCPVIGIGAPAGYFVKRVARALHSSFLLPEHAAVANAAGAVVGMIMIETEFLVYVRESGEVRKYIVQGSQENLAFKEEEEALRYARQSAEAQAAEKCRASGAVEPQVDISETSEGPLRRIIARAVGNPGF
ncbi:MAG: hydantoinase/oxoprolinase N-terminal domain-containing protein [Desulfosudaceae bacterium]